MKSPPVLATAAVLSISILPKTAWTANLNLKCRQIEQAAYREIQSNISSIGSANYLILHDDEYRRMSGLQQRYPNCNLYRSGRPDAATRRQMQRWQDSIDNSVSESVRQEGITQMVLTCGRYGRRYDRDDNICVDID